MVRITERKLLEEYSKIWATYESTLFPEIISRGFLFQFDGVTNVDILFIGINPSYKDGDPTLCGSYSQSEDENHPYFKQFIEIQSKLSEKYSRAINWTHLDLLVFRETRQDFIKNELINDPLGPAFIMEQLEIAKKLLEYVNPKVIVVSNTMARRLMGKDITPQGDNAWMNLGFKFDPELGTDIVKIKDNKTKTPVFFTSMLSGQRALDNGSKERLVWHIDRVLS